MVKQYPLQSRTCVLFVLRPFLNDPVVRADGQIHIPNFRIIQSIDRLLIQLRFCSPSNHKNFRRNILKADSHLKIMFRFVILITRGKNPNDSDIDCEDTPPWLMPCGDAKFSTCFDCPYFNEDTFHMDCGLGYDISDVIMKHAMNQVDQYKDRLKQTTRNLHTRRLS